MRVLLLILPLWLSAAASARDYRLCVDANPWATYTLPDRDGSLQVLMRKVLAQRGDSVTFIALPWLRCEAMAENGSVDGLLGVPGTASARERFAFPLKQGLIDPARAATVAELVLLRRADADVSWDGRKLTGLKDKVAYVQGYDEISERLDELGIPHSGDYHSDDQNMKALLADRTNVIATYSESADILMRDPAYRGKLVRLQPALGRLYYYAAFSRKLYESDRERIEEIWRLVAQMRNAG
jgi:polar amino acid transport system substrate-binding protein